MALSAQMGYIVPLKSMLWSKVDNHEHVEIWHVGNG